MRKRSLCAAVVCGVMGLSLAACVPDVDNSDSMPAESGSYLPTAPSVEQGATAQEIYAYDREIEKEWAPKVVTMEDGTQVQKVPNSGEYSMALSSVGESAYNTMYLNAENRGCDSCHEEGLADLVANHLATSHFPITTGLGTNIDVFTCMGCHGVELGLAYPSNGFGHLMHGIHSTDAFKGDCMSCHTATSDGGGMPLWEEAKYDLFRGINKIPNATGDFSYDQDVLAGKPEWVCGTSNTTMVEENLVGPLSGPEPSDEMFDNWEISVSGMVDKPYSITMKEVVETAPVETFISKLQCQINPAGGEFVGEFEVTGVPVSWFLEKAGVQDGANAVMPHASDGYGDHYGYGLTFEDLDLNKAYVVWEINGERLTSREGFPVRFWVPTRSADLSLRYLTDLVVTDNDWVYSGTGGHYTDYIDDNGVHHTTDGYTENDPVWGDKPNAAICHTYEGQIIPVGEKYTFEGYADAFNEPITAIEFSMDNGETWTRYDVPDADPNKWVYWYFGFTPEEEGAYTLSVRAISPEAGTPVFKDTVMVNAK